MSQPAPAPLPRQGADGAPVFDARALIPDGVKAEIVLDGQSYTLRITRAGKLILTK
ncbi:hemin uptake protein HemP [Tropicibacter naphthalenivorans]|uniref:Hemin uptake protein n=1 Tax=Tropicibacter naphthalenivorans TaxID=441103 RepID=A0A0P1GYI2_9RHOB|nr:hemin uptake protein HemP [Tropicibacter naphthalenivorans]CUH81004.1 Hemin uptake protein [Tropicibacter naphthalenivorans]SMC91871.1 Hemin uptake protein HemP [Tropicibacter naphthalenivorans]